MHFIGVFNQDGGTFRTMNLGGFTEEARRVFAEHGHELECRIVAGRGLRAALEAAAADPQAEALLVGGGDGTVAAAAGVCFRAGLPLAILPGGTMNLFARALRLPLDLANALPAMAAGRVRSVDIATANGRPFVHQYSVGIHARLVRLRETRHYHSRWGKMLASVGATVVAVSQPLTFDVEIVTPRRLERRRVSGISVSNNILAEGHYPHADAIDQGVLGIYVIAPMASPKMAGFWVSMLLGRWKDNPALSEQQVQRVSLRFPRRKASALALLDGELVGLDERVDIEIHPLALKVVVPND